MASSMDRASMGERPRASAGVLLGFLAGVAGLAAGITLVFLGMRAVMEIGGACATGGPYVPAVECPEGVPAVTLIGVFGGLAGAFLATACGARIPGPWGAIALLAWPALFISLGWNFLESGLDPPGQDGLEWGWLFCGVVFVALGAVPLLVAIRWRDDVRAGVVATQLDATAWPRLSRVDPELVRRAALSTDHPMPMPMAGTAAPEAPAARGLVDELERLAALRDRGDLTADEYAAAKRALLGEAVP
jgi:hypothetical protein